MNGNKLLKRFSAMEGSFSFFFAVIIYLIVSVLFGLIAKGVDAASEARLVLNFIAGLVVQAGFLASALLPARVLGSRLTYKIKKPTVKICALAVAIAVICVVGFEGLALAFNMTLVGNGYVDTTAVSMTGGLVIALTVIRAVLVAPVCEEVLFRGSVLSSLGVMGSFREKYRVSFMIVTCGLLFALMHMNPMQTVYQFLLGCTLAYVTIRFGSIVPAIIIHLTNNVIGVILSIPAIDTAIGGMLASIFGTAWIALFIGVGVVLAVAAVLAIRALCRKFGGQTPFSPDKEMRTEGGSFTNSADDSGTLAGIILTAVGALICVAMWLSVLMAGF